LSGGRDLNPRPSPWQGDVLPLNYRRDNIIITKNLWYNKIKNNGGEKEVEKERRLFGAGRVATYSQKVPTEFQPLLFRKGGS
jgi:hypothetical protein